MPNEDVQKWLDMKRDAHEQARAHVDQTHRATLLAGVLAGCESILLAAEMIAGSANRVGFVEDVYRALLRCAKGQSEEQLRVEVQAMWERRRG